MTADPESATVIGRLRAAGIVFAEEEAAILAADSADAAELRRRLSRRTAGEPLEHIVGWVDFGGLRLAVGPGVFVPRQRSLLLARTTVDAVRTATEPVVVEPFCGVAPIAAFTRSRLGTARVHVCDLDTVALRFARRNLGSDAGVHQGRDLAVLPDDLRGRVDVIAAVPPYVPDHALDQLPHEARDHEPHRALLGGTDGLDHIRTLITSAAQWISPSGTVLVEMNHAQFDAAAAAAAAVGLTADAVIDPDDDQTVVARCRRPPPAAHPAA